MKKQKFLFFCCLVAGSSLLGQNNLTMLHHLGTVQIFSGNTGFVDAYNAALSGDTIYLGGGIYNAPTTLSKSLVVYGAGINIDSSSVTGTTTITGPLNFYEGADNSSFQGISTSVAFNNIDIDNISFRYCRLTGITYVGTYIPGNTCDNQQYINCFIGNSDFNYSDFNTVGSLVIQNTIITQFVKNIHANGLMDHCIFTIGPYYNPANGVNRPIKDVSNSTISNCKIRNIGTYYNYVVTGSNNLFTKNAFNLSYTDVANTYTSNYYVGSDDNLFFVGDPDLDGKYDYHLQSPGSYPGTDGAQICLYGGDLAWKDGSMAGNPHILFKNIPPASNNNGTLDVNIKVNSQDY